LDEILILKTFADLGRYRNQDKGRFMSGMPDINCAIRRVRGLRSKRLEALSETQPFGRLRMRSSKEFFSDLRNKIPSA